MPPGPRRPRLRSRAWSLAKLVCLDEDNQGRKLLVYIGDLKRVLEKNHPRESSIEERSNLLESRTAMAKRKRVWPEWWQWELDISDHANEYMPVREFTEIDLRRMTAYDVN